MTQKKLLDSQYPIIYLDLDHNRTDLINFISSESKKNQYTLYNLSLKFVRNMGRGFSRTDIRNLKVNARIYKNGRIDVYYGNVPTSRNTFDLVSLNIGGDLKVNTVKFYDGQSLVKSLATSGLPKATRK